MRGRIVLAIPAALTALLVTAVACTTSYPVCYRGEYVGCLCANGASGYQTCNVTEDGFQACVCDGTTPGLDGGRDASGEAGEAGDAAGEAAAAAGAYMMPCGANGACAEANAVCFEFGNKGKVCTKACTQSSECPPPSPGCSANQQICRAP